MKKMMKPWMSTAAAAVLTLVLTACNPDPTEGKDAAEVSDEVVTPEPAAKPESEAGSEPKAMPEEAASGTESAPETATEEPSAESEPAEEEAAAETVAYAIDKDSSVITFIGSKPTANHTGGWSEYSGTISVPGGDFTKADINVEIDMKSTYSDDSDLTEKLMGTDFFEVEKFPTSTFKSTKIVEADDGYKVSGNLNLHGITKNLTFPATVKMDEESLTAEAEFSFNRKIFEIDYDGMADDLIRDNVLMTFYIEADAK